MGEKKFAVNSFKDGMSKDIASELLPNTYYRRGVNIRIFKSGHKGIVVNCKGNVEIVYDLPEGNNRCIGSYSQTESNKFYWFNWNSEGYHGIYMYDGLLNAVIPVLVNKDDTNGIDILEFSERSLILHIDIVKAQNGNDLLYWCNKDTKAKKINIQKALDKSSEGYGSVITAEFINAYKLAPIFPASISYFTDTTRLTNYLYGNLYKVSYRHIFDDGEKSNWSEFSTVPLPQNESFTGNAAISNVNNCLKISVETGSRIVKQIEIAIKSGSQDFVSIANIDKEELSISNNSQYVYSFYNDSTSYSGLPQIKVQRAYSFLPKDPELQAFANTAMVYGGGKDGFPTVQVYITTEAVYTDLFVDDSTVNELNDPSITAELLDYDFTREGDGRRRNSLIRITIGNDVKAGNKFEIFPRNGDGESLYFTKMATLTDDAIAIANGFKTQFVATGRVLATSPELPPTDIWANTINGSGDVSFSFIWEGLNKQPATEFGNFIPPRVNPVSFQTLKDNGQSVPNHKSGGSVKYGITYWDEDTRRSQSFTSDEAFVRNEFVTESGAYKKIEHRLSIKHLPPIWAKYYDITRTEDLTYGTSWIHVLVQKAIESQSATNTEYVDLVVGSLFTYQRMYPNTIVNYNFEKNDRVRLIKKETDGTFYSFLETVVLDYSDNVEEVVNEDITTDNTNIVTIGGATNADNIGRYIEIDNVERLIIAAPSGTTYSLDRSFGTAAKYTSFKIVDRRGIIRVRKPVGITIEDNSLIEVYKPTQNIESAEKNFFLFGQKYAIKDWGTDDRCHTGNVQNQDPLNPVTTPAIVSISKGTSYVRQRQLPTNNILPGTQVVNDLIEDKSFSDFYESNLNDNGKISVQDDGSGERRFPDRLRFSNNYIEDTRINGLNDFDNTDRKDYNDPFGGIKLIRFIGRFLYVFKQNRAGYIPILSTIIQGNDGKDVALGASKDLLNELQYFSWEGGIGNNPESWTSDQNWQWFLSPDSGTDCRIGGDGILPTSHQFGLDEEVRERIKLAVKYSSFIHGGYEREFNERRLNFEHYNEYLFNGGFDEFVWKLREEDLPALTEYEVTTQPLHGTVTLDADNNFVYTPTTDYVGTDYFYYRWREPGGEWSLPKKECGEVVEIEQPEVIDTYYNAELSLPYTMQGCDNGYHGSVVNYIVEEFKYSSPFSQADADQQAQDDADANGQAFADDPANGGTCIVNDPAPFSFTDLTGLELNTLTESDAIIVPDDYDDYIISISGSGTSKAYQVNGGAWVDTPGIVTAGDSVKMRRNTSSLYSTTVSATLTIGSVSDTWNITTEDAPVGNELMSSLSRRMIAK